MVSSVPGRSPGPVAAHNPGAANGNHAPMPVKIAMAARTTDPISAAIADRYPPPHSGHGGGQKGQEPGEHSHAEQFDGEAGDPRPSRTDVEH